MFDGSAANVVPWLCEIQDAVHLQRATLPTDYDKSVYLAGYLKQGTPKSWYQGIRASNEDLLYDFDALVKDFRDHFGDSNVSATSLRKLKVLKQTGSCASYASRSRELHVDCDLNESTKIDLFYAGLKDPVKDLLLNVKRSLVFDEFVAQCVDIDNRLHERELERKHNTSAPTPRRTQDHHHSRQNHTQAAAPLTSSQVVPMEIDAVKRGPISTDEKARRKREGLCFYCGQGKHRVEDCPNMSEKAKLAFKARRNAQQASSSGKA